MVDDNNLVSLRQMIERWCDERKFGALSLLLPGYLSLNGLTDGWGNLYVALKATRALGHEVFNVSDWDLLNDLIHSAERIVYRR
ncbi:MAG: hypothetical protein ABI191_00045 [Rhizomicrobium sp.]